MTDRPIIFSAPMVRALLAGTKTQTRRVLKPQPPADCGPLIVGLYCPTRCDRHGEEYPGAEVFGTFSQDGAWATRIRVKPGDHLWVRESWKATGLAAFNKPLETRICGRFAYMADDQQLPRDSMIPWRPSIHMPRWASRLTLVVTDVRVERLQEISEADAKAEGAIPYHCAASKVDTYGPSHTMCGQDHRAGFCKIWEMIKGIESWDANPWVVAYTFTVHRCNIDQMAEASA